MIYIIVFILTLGTFGALEQGSIGFSQFFIQIGLLALIALTLFLRKKGA